jgi:hypothetical protein
LSANHEHEEEYVSDLSKLVQEHRFTPEQIYNMDETGLFWRCLLERTFVCSDEKAASNVKESRERVTVLTCANAAGTHKCKLMVIGKSAKPQALKGIKIFSMIYHANKRAWITQEIFGDWFNTHFVPEVRDHAKKVELPDNVKILLLLYNCPAHPPAETLIKQNIFVSYLPPNCTALIQLLDQGIIKNFKCHYRSELMQKIVNFDGPFSYDCFKKAITLKEAVWCISRAWDNVTPTVLKWCWHNILPATTYNEDDSETEFLGFHSSKDNGDITESANYVKGLNAVKDLSENDLEEWTECDKNAPDSQTLTDSKIIDAVLSHKLNESEDSDDSNGSADEENKMTMARSYFML